MNPEYFRRLQGTLAGVTRNLTAKGIDADRLAFGGEGARPTRRPTVPTDARSEFLANRAMGDWAERMLTAALSAACPEWTVAQYGKTDRIAAGHPQFRERYLEGLEETRRLGKRPDLLVFSAKACVDADLSERPQAETEVLVQ